MTPIDVLAEVGVRLTAAGIPWMLVGSYAAAVHGHPRATRDLDIVIETDAPRLRAFVLALGSDWYADPDAALEALRFHTLFNALHVESGWKIDLIPRKPRPFSAAEFQRRQPATVAGSTVWVATVEDVVLAKLEWAALSGSQRQIEDVAALLQVNRDLDLDWIERWLDELDARGAWNRARTLHA
jgi:hypothetical protein